MSDSPNGSEVVVEQPAPEVVAETEQKQGAELFDMLDKVVEKREKQFARQTLEANGIDAEQIKSVVEEWSKNRSNSLNAINSELSRIKAENESLKAAALKSSLDSALSSAMTEAGVEASKLSYVTRLADLSEAVAKDGSVDADKVKAALEKLLTDIPELKGEVTGVRKLGSDGGDKAKATDDVVDSLLKAAGVKTKKE